MVFRIFEAGIEPYYSRYLVDGRWLRIDEGTLSAQYILFDRRERTIYSVDHEAETILEIAERPVGDRSPIPLSYEIHGEGGRDYRVAGAVGEGRRVMLNGRFCQMVTSLPSVLPGVTAALADYRRLLAGEHAGSVVATPPELLDPCDLALNVFHAERHLEWGLPLDRWEARGYRELLIDFELGVVPEAGWSTLPEGFSRYSP